MPRVKRGVTSRAKHKKVLQRAEGHYGARHKLIKTARESVPGQFPATEGRVGAEDWASPDRADSPPVTVRSDPARLHRRAWPRSASRGRITCLRWV